MTRILQFLETIQPDGMTNLVVNGHYFIWYEGYWHYKGPFYEKSDLRLASEIDDLSDLW